MNSMTLPIDIQNQTDHRRIDIDEVGVRQLLYPIRLASDGNIYSQECAAHFSLAVTLPADKKGTHMSRFVELLESNRAQGYDSAQVRALFQSVLTHLGARSGRITLAFPFFAEKSAPVSGVKSLMDYHGGWTLEQSVATDHKLVENIWVRAPVTSLCPCSKAISKYGAHNQRSEITLSAQYRGDPSPSFAALIAIAEEEASCQLYGILKRPDEKFVTEHAYEHPKFVEDLVRDVAIRLKKHPQVAHFEVTAENFESIHNHSAYAIVRG